MKICVTATANSLDAQIDPRFGRCSYFIIVDSETLQFEAVSNMAAGASGGAGIQAAQTVANKSVKLLIAGNVGPKAFQALSAAGIEVATGAFGSVREAVEKYKKAIEINPKLEIVYLFLGDCLQKLERYEEAVDLFEKHLPDSMDSNVIHAYGDSLMGMKHYSEALKQYEQIMSNQPEYYQVYLSYGQLMEKTRKKERAIFAYLKYISVGSDRLTKDFDFQKP